MGTDRRRLRWEWVAAAVILVAIALTGAITSDGASAPPKKQATVNFGKAQAKVHTAAVSTPPIVPLIRTYSFTKASNKGCPCVQVTQLQLALQRAKFRPVKSKSTGIFGKHTRDQIRAFQKAHHISQTGVYGPKTHLALSKFYDSDGRARLIEVSKTRHYLAVTRGLQTIGYHYYRVGGSTLIYSQSASRGNLGHYPFLPPATDCSGFVTAIFKADGLPDPNGFSYSPVGYTGTLALHGVPISANGTLHIGDLVFYGGGYPFGHVTMVIDPARRLVISHGSTGVRILPIRYRPVSAVRRYFS